MVLVAETELVAVVNVGVTHRHAAVLKGKGKGIILYWERHAVIGKFISLQWMAAATAEFIFPTCKSAVPRGKSVGAAGVAAISAVTPDPVSLSLSMGMFASDSSEFAATSPARISNLPLSTAGFGCHLSTPELDFALTQAG
jgi:hypothetical protein